jgi:hypothetical protein
MHKNLFYCIPESIEFFPFTDLTTAEKNLFLSTLVRDLSEDQYRIKTICYLLYNFSVRNLISKPFISRRIAYRSE